MSDEFNEVKQRVLQLCPPWPVDSVGRAIALLNDTAVQKLTGLPQAIFETTLTALLQQANQGRRPSWLPFLPNCAAACSR